MTTPRRVALLVTCLNDALFPDVGIATVRLLRRLGCTVEFPVDQTCCGQMHMNTGYQPEAGALARRYAEVFAGFDAVVTPSASCAGCVRHQHALLLGKGHVPPPTFELTEFIVDVLGVEDVGATYPHRVTYHPTCHSLRALRLGDRPHRLLRHVRGLELVELPDDDQCCGFGGTFALKNAPTSSAMLADKLSRVRSTGVQACTAVDSSCLMQIAGGLRRADDPVRAVHLAEILATT